MDEILEVKLADWRAKAAAGLLTMPEMVQAIEYLRSQRATATVKAKKKGTSKKVVDANELLGELKGL